MLLERALALVVGGEDASAVAVIPDQVVPQQEDASPNVLPRVARVDRGAEQRLTDPGSRSPA